MATPHDNPCLSCGACCASYRVDFSTQQLQSQGGCVPDSLTVELNDSTCRMRGTDHASPRCAALVGTIGQKASCGIYEWRPDPCREFGMLVAFGQIEAACNQARVRHGLPPLI
jgi:Fe-S-cluster containining protein